MNKADLVEHIAKRADLSKAAAGRAVDSMFEAVIVALKNGDSVNLAGFGTFVVGERAARVGRNPRTKEPLTIEAAKVPRFKAGKAMKDAVR